MNPAAQRARWIRELVGAVARQALADRGADRIALLDDGSPEAGLAADWLAAELGAQRLVRIRPPQQQLESVLQALRAAPDIPDRVQNHRGRTEREAGWARARQLDELRRLVARLLRGALVANPANKTALLLAGEPPPDPFLPLGDLYASEVLQLAGGWSAAPEVRVLIESCGGVERLDAALRALLDHRETAALAPLGPAAAAAITAALARGRPARVFGTLVPKLGPRTLAVDLFE